MKKFEAIKVDSLRFNDDTILGCLFLLYFCGSILASIVFRLFGREAISVIYLFFFLLLFVIYAAKHIKDTFVPFLLFCLVSLLFLVTYIIHPEYSAWFSHDVYGFVPAIISPGSAMWAFMIVWLVKDEDKLVRFLKIACFFAFLFYSLQFLAATVRGYWEYLDVDNTTILRESYSLEFGYNMLMPVSFMGACAYFRNEKRYFILYFLGLIMILLGGSRGALIWPILMVPVMLLLNWKQLSTVKKTFLGFFIFFLVSTGMLFVLKKDAVIVVITSLLSKYGVSSRTIFSILNGSFSDANGRDQIYGMALELIRTGGLFGHGIYGDRYVIGNTFRWGYSHNLFLELFVSFGYFGGAILSCLLVFGVIALCRKCENANQKVVVTTFLITSMKLMLSNSFWYTSAFWALLALMLLWRKTQNRIIFG